MQQAAAHCRARILPCVRQFSLHSHYGAYALAPGACSEGSTRTA